MFLLNSPARHLFEWTPILLGGKVGEKGLTWGSLIEH